MQQAPLAEPKPFALGDLCRAEGYLGDRLFRFLTAAVAVLLVATLGSLALQTLRASSLSLKRFGLVFVTGTLWDPVHQTYGALPFVYGTVVSSLLALVVAVPVALGVAVYLAELCPRWIRTPLGFTVELLAAIPSVVYGLWAVFLLAPWLRDTVERPLLSVFKGPARGFDLLSGSLVLAVMVLPTIASVSRDVLRAVPNTLREATQALGATRWETIRVAVLPSARAGLVGAILLGLGRALGETMAVTMVIGNRAEISASPLAPAYTMASVIANEYAEATDELHLAALSEIALLLFVVTMLLNAAARLLVWSVNRPRRSC